MPRKEKKPLSEAKRKELATRAKLGPRLGYPKVMPRPPVANPRPGGTRRRGSIGGQHPTRDTSNE